MFMGIKRRNGVDIFEVARKDAQLAKVREGAKPAGEADPYKHADE